MGKTEAKKSRKRQYRTDESGGRVAEGDVQGIGLSVRLARREAGLKQSDLADLAGVSERTVRAIETGTGNPTLAAVVSVANVLGLRVAAV
jgi:DNA-binding XRE family transcriptional regulator